MTKPKFKNILKGVVIATFLIASFIIIRDDAFYWFDSSEDYSNYYSDVDVDEETDSTNEQQYCDIMGIELHGEVTTYGFTSETPEGELAPVSTSADEILWAIRDAEANSRVKALILEVDSYGGSGVAGEEMANALKNATKPVVALVRDGAASAAYLAATGADYIIASAFSDVGGIGVTASYLDYSKQNLAEGITYNELNTAKYKDMRDPDKSLTDDEKALMQRDLDIMHNGFVKAVAENRKLDIAKVSQLADGSTMLGQMALDNGLIDQIGSQDAAIQYFIDKGVIEGKHGVCWYLP